ncbi:MAG: hypothetical protein PHH77_01610 [Victivallaceae bacterium]|nr:hypothetical protein [Victivallaceae bacterium]
MLDNRAFRKRADLIVLGFAVWGAISIGVFFYYAVIAREQYIQLGNKLARREITYYPERARILDKNGVVLAWSEKYYDLYYIDILGSPKRTKMILGEVMELLPNLEEPVSGTVYSVIFRSLQPAQIMALEKTVYRFQELQIMPRIERKAVNYPEIRAYLGQVKSVSGRLLGVSGLEKQYNVTLSGIPGRYRVMLDRNKNWIKDSGELLRPAVPGKELQLPLTLEEIRTRHP